MEKSPDNLADFRKGLDRIEEITRELRGLVDRLNSRIFSLDRTMEAIEKEMESIPDYSENRRESRKPDHGR